MKLTARTFLFVLVAFALVVPAQGVTQARPATGASPVLKDGIRLSDSSEDGFVADITVPAATLQDVTLDGRRFQRVTLPGYAAHDQPGQPAVPVRGWLIGLPPGATADVRVTFVDSVPLTGVQLAPAPHEGRAALDPAQTSAEQTPDAVLSYPQDPAVYGQDVFWPAAQAALEAPSPYRDLSTMVLKVFPVQYNPARSEVLVARSLRVQVTFNYPHGRSAPHARPEAQIWLDEMARNVLNWDSARNWLNTPASGAAPRPAVPQTVDAWRITVNSDAMYRANYSDLAAAGFPPNLALYRLRLKNSSGTEQHIRLVDANANSVFDSGDYILFWGQKVTGDKYTSTNAYWLTTDGTSGAPGLRMQEVSAAPAGGPVPAAYTQSLHLEQNHYYRNTVPMNDLTDHWYWSYAMSAAPPNTASTSVTLTNAVLGSALPLRLALYGFEYYDHSALVKWNNTTITTTTWTGQVPPALNLSVPAGSVTQGVNVLAITAVTPTAGLSHSIFLDAVEVDYRHSYRADGDQVIVTADSTSNWRYQVGGFNQGGALLEAYDISDAQNVRHVNGAVLSGGGSYTYTFQLASSGPANHFLVQKVAAQIAPAGIVHDTPSNIVADTSQTDYIMIVADSLASSAQPLASLRTRHPCADIARNCTVRVINAQDVYDEFSGGVATATAIEDFLNWAYSSGTWAAPAPSFVLLFGDGNYDPQGYCLVYHGCPSGTGWMTGQASLLPPYLASADGNINETVADHCYVASGPCGLYTAHSLPFMHLGRIPASTTAEATIAVNKQISYEEGLPAGSWRSIVLNTCDNPDEAGNFWAICDGYAARIRTSVLNVDCDYYTNDLAHNGLPCYYYNNANSAPDAFTDKMVAGINNGAAMTTFTGHAFFLYLGKKHLWELTDVDRLTNINKLTFWYPMTCWDGYYIFPSQTSMAEKFLFASNGGSVGSFSPTGLDVVTGHEFLRDGLSDAVFVNNQRALGVLTDAGKLYLWTYSTAYRNLLETYMLVGDPAEDLAVQPFNPATLTHFAQIPAAMR